MALPSSLRLIGASGSPYTHFLATMDVDRRSMYMRASA